MSKILKNVLFSVGIFAFTLALVGAVSTNTTYAAACVAEASGDWNDNATWDAGCHGDGTFPTAGDDVTIPSGFTVNVNTASAADSLVINNAGAATGLTFDAVTLTIDGATTLNAPSADGTTTVAIGAGTLDTGSLVIAGGAGSRISEVTLAPSGSLTVDTTVTLSGTAANARLTTSGAGAKTISITTNLINGGTITFGGGTLTSTVTGTTTISTGGSITASDATGTYTYTDAFVVDAGGVYNETVAGTAHTFSSTVDNAGTMTVNTGTHTFSGVITNTGTFNYANGATLTANTQLAASTEGTINYTGAAQTVTLVDYFNLGLSGSGVKTIGVFTVLNNLAISGTAVASLTGDSTVANFLTLGGVQKATGSWGSTSSVATYKNNTYFAGTGTVDVAAGTEAGSSGDRGSGTTVTYTPPAATDDDADEEEETTPAEPATPTPGCSGTNKYSSTTGALCVSAVAQVAIAGCDNRNTGYSSTTGSSCVGNTVSAAATSGTYNFGTVTLRSGGSGSTVMDLQKFLNVKMNAGLSVDGKFGPLTAAAVRAWQAANGLVADGLFGPMSRAKAAMQ